MALYRPGTEETDLKKVIMSLQAVATAADTHVAGPGASTDNAAVRFDGAGGYTVQDSALIIADTTGALSRSGNGGIPVQGTNTNDSAAAGYVGELIDSSIPFASAVSLTSGAAADVTSIPLTAGNWLAWGNVAFVPGATTTSTRHAAWVSATSATFPTAPNGGALAEMQVAYSAGFSPTFAVGMMRISLASPATYYLGAFSVFAISTMKAYGYIGALRVR